MDISSRKNIKIGAILTYITQFLSIVISFVYVPIMLNKLGPSEYGLYSIVQSLISYLQMSEMGIGTTATRYNSKYIEENNTNGQRLINGMFFKMYLGIAVVCCIVAAVLFVFLDVIYADYSLDNLRLIKILFAIAVVNLVITFVFSIFDSIIIAHEDYIFLKISTLIRTILGPAGMLAILFLGFRSIGMLVVTTAISLVFGLVQMIFCLNKYRISFDLKGYDHDLFKKILSFTIFVFINSLATQLMMNSDKVIISIVMTETAVAVYAVVMQFHTYSYNFANVLSGFYLPRYTKIVSKANEITEELSNDLVRTGRIQVLIAGLIFGGFLAIGEPFILRWVGVEYREVYWLTVIVLLTEVIGASQSMFNSLMQAMNLHKIRALLSMIVSVVKVLLTVLMTMRFGLLGCALAFFLGWLVKQIVFNLYYSKCVGIKIRKFWIDMMKIYIPLLITVTILYVATQFTLGIFPATTYPILLLYCLVYTMLYCGITYLIALSSYEKTLVTDIFRKFRRHS